jgi:hypothetical protein
MKNEKGNTNNQILNVEYPISNVKVEYEFPRLKFFTSTFNIRYSIFDISFFPFLFLCFSFLILHFNKKGADRSAPAT